MSTQDPGNAALIEEAGQDGMKKTALMVVPRARALAVVDQDTLTIANDLLRDIKAARKWFDNEHDAGIDQAYAHHKYLVAQKRKWTDPLDEAEKAIKPKIGAYLRAEDDRRREAERAAQRAREIAAKEAEDTADVAHELIAEGKPAEAAQVVEMQAERIEKIQAAAPVVPEKPIAEGTSLSKRWTWDRDTVNLALVPREFLKVDEAKVTRHVQNMKWDAKIPGIHIYPVDDVITRLDK